MKYIISVYLTVLLLISNPSFALDYMDEVNLIDNIIKSFDEEPDNWYFGTSYAVYAKSPTQLKKALEVPYPEHDPNSIILFSFNLNSHSGSYISFNKPEIGFVSEGHDKEFKKFDRAIKIQLYKKLKFEVGNESEVKIKRREVIEKTKEIKDVGGTFKPL